MTEQIPKEIRVAAKHGAVRDVSRLVSFGDVVYQLGTWLYRKSLRYTLLTAGIAGLGYVSSFAGLPGFSGKQAIALPLIVGTVTLLSGVLLAVIPAAIASRQMTVAQASDMDLMEDYRKSEADTHLRSLWERVYSHEYGLAERAVGREPDRRGGESSFLARAHRAMESHLSQPREVFELGVDLRYYEDWCNGGYFDQSDVKLVEQYEGSVGLAEAKNHVGFGLLDTLRQLPARFAQRLWFTLITRAVAVHVAECVESLNRQHRTDVFNAQVLLWPGEEQAAWLEQFPGAREEVLDRRQRLMLRIFGPDRATARNLLDRMFGPNIELATELRTRFDPEYCVGGLGYDACSDLESAELLRDHGLTRRVRARVARAKDALETFRRHLDEAHPALCAPDQGETLRAVLIAFLTDRDGLKRRFLKGTGQGAPPEVLRSLSDALVALGREDRSYYSRLLLGLRQHHELTRLERMDYYQLVDDLWPK